MVYITTSNSHRRIRWECDKLRLGFQWRIRPDDVVCILAFGKELEFIRKEFGATIPFSNQADQKWYGDIAKSIAYSLLQIED